MIGRTKVPSVRSTGVADVATASQGHDVTGRAKTAVKRILASRGYSLVSDRDGQGPRRFYDVEPTCQIVDLAGLLEVIFGVKTDGFFVEVGGYDGVTHSNVTALAKAGWSGVVIEPVPQFAAMCREHYAKHPGVTVIESAVGSEAGELPLTVAGSLSTGNAGLAAEYQDIDWAAPTMADAREIVVPINTLDSLLAQLSPRPAAIDFISIDVEGFEAEVLQGFDLDLWQPRMIAIELTDVHPDIQSTRDADSQSLSFLESKGYDIVYKDAINTCLVRNMR
jgi:FkbM family methyltransferase